MKIVKFYIALIFLSLTGSALAQYKATSELSGVGLPFFQSGIFRTFTEDGSERIVRLYLQMVNDDLTFVKQNDRYVSEIQIEIYVSNDQKESVFNRTIDKHIVTADFDSTNSREIKNTFKVDIPLKPDEYDAVIIVIDKNSDKQVNRKINFQLKNISRSGFLVSDVMFFSKYKMDSTGRISWFEPILSSNFSSQKDYICFYFTTVVTDTTDTLNIRYNIKNPEGAIIQFNQYSLVNQPSYNENFIRINRRQFDQSRYKLNISGHYAGNTIKTSKLFTFFWTVTPGSPKDLDRALQQMEYLMEADSIDWALEQPYEERLAYFKRFWKRMDPNPETEKNELLDEYFRRVNYANEHFSTISNEGWTTDRGRIFIKFGEPDDIERHPFELQTYPYVIWRYYTLRKVFVFVDRTGFGDYYLHPNYLDEEFN